MKKENYSMKSEINTNSTNNSVNNNSNINKQSQNSNILSKTKNYFIDQQDYMNMNKDILKSYEKNNFAQVKVPINKINNGVLNQNAKFLPKIGNILPQNSNLYTKSTKKKDSDNIDNQNCDQSEDESEVKLDYHCPEKSEIMLMNNVLSNCLTVFFNYPSECELFHNIIVKENSCYVEYLQLNSINNSSNNSDVKNTNELFLFGLNDKYRNNKEFSVLYKAYKNVPDCITLPMECNGIIRSLSYFKANIIWKLLKLPKMEQLIRKLNKFQRYNHFPCTWQIGRKDNLWRNYSEIKKRFGSEHFNYLPKTYILPDDIVSFRKEVLPYFSKSEQENINNKDNKKSKMFIIKPVASSRGRGIKLMTSASGVPKKCLVSKYIDNPFIINNKKFDLRLYVVITGFAPLKVYLFKEGLVRFASEDYNTDVNNNFVHLTNYSINKNNQNFDFQVSAQNETTGSKWSLSALRKYFNENNIDYDKLFVQIKDIVVKSVISIADKSVEATDKLTKHNNCLFELYGFDVLLDSNLRPWLMEVNLNPSLNTDTPLDLKIKSMLMTDIYNLVGIEPYSHITNNKVNINSNYREKILPNKKLQINKGQSVSNKSETFTKISNFIDIAEEESVNSDLSLKGINKREVSKSLQKNLAPLKNTNLPKYNMNSNTKSLVKHNTNSNLLNLNLKEDMSIINNSDKESKRYWNDTNIKMQLELENKSNFLNDKCKMF